MKHLIENLQRIRELTESVSLSSIANLNHDFVEYDVIEGKCVGRGLLKQSKVAVQIAYLSPDTVMPKHGHDETEILILVDGDLITESSEGITSLTTPGDIVKIKGDSHIPATKNGCTLICITIPANLKGYPDAT